MEERRQHWLAEARKAPERFQSQSQFVFSFYILKAQGGWASKKSLQVILCGNQQVVKSKDPSFQLFSSYCIPGRNWVMIGNTSGALSKSVNESINKYLSIGLFNHILNQL